MDPPGPADGVTAMFSVPGAPLNVVLLTIVPLSAKMPNARSPFVLIGPVEITLMLPLPEKP